MKRGYARAVEIVTWMRDYARTEQLKSKGLVAEVWQGKADAFQEVVNALVTKDLQKKGRP